MASYIGGGDGPFSAAASMAVSSDSDANTKTARLDVTQSFHKQRVTSKGLLRVLPHTKLNPAYVDYIQAIDIANVEQLSFDLGIFFACASNLGGLIRKSYTMQVTADDTQSSLEGEITGEFGSLIGENNGGGVILSTRSNGAKMSTSFHAEGGDTSLWVSPSAGQADVIGSRPSGSSTVVRRRFSRVSVRC